MSQFSQPEALLEVKGSEMGNGRVREGTAEVLRPASSAEAIPHPSFHPLHEKIKATTRNLKKFLLE